MLKQHLEKCSKMNKKQLQAIVAPSQVQSASTGILGAAPDQGTEEEPGGLLGVLHTSNLPAACNLCAQTRSRYGRVCSALLWRFLMGIISGVYDCTAPFMLSIYLHVVCCLPHSACLGRSLVFSLRRTEKMWIKGLWDSKCRFPGYEGWGVSAYSKLKLILQQSLLLGSPHVQLEGWEILDMKRQILQSTLPSSSLMWIWIIPYPKQSMKGNLLCPQLGAAGIFMAGKLPKAALFPWAFPLPKLCTHLQSPEAVLGTGTQSKAPK